MSTLPGTGPFGPLAPHRLALMGIRFADGEDGGNPSSGEPAGSDPPPAAETPPAPMPHPPAPPAGSTPPAEPKQEPPAEGDEPAGSVDELPSWAQREIRTARNEAKNLRTRLGEATTTAKQERDALVQDIGKALGLVKEETTDPAALLEAARRDSEDNRGAARAAKIELAVYRAAIRQSADADALLDSRSFIEKLGALDPTTDDFSARVTDLIKEQVDAQPSKYKVAPVAPASSDGKPMNGQPNPAADDIETFRKRYRESRGVVA